MNCPTIRPLHLSLHHSFSHDTAGGTEAKSVGAWLKAGWHIAVAYVIGFFIMLIIVGWHPHEPHKANVTAPTAEQPAH